MNDFLFEKMGLACNPEFVQACQNLFPSWLEKPLEIEYTEARQKMFMEGIEIEVKYQFNKDRDYLDILQIISETADIYNLIDAAESSIGITDRIHKILREKEGME